MTRTLTAAVALTAALGMAGLAHAQSSTNPSTSPSTMNPTGATQSPSTMGTTGASSSGTQGPQANMNQPASQADIQQAQQQLKSQGLYRGAVDGVMGPETQTALMAFQREHSLPQTAQLDQQTLSALSGGGSNSGAGMTGGSTTGTSQPGGAAGMTNGPAGTTNPATNGGSYNR